MGFFDIFSSEPAQNAAAAKTAALQQGYSQYYGLADQARGAINTNYGQAAQPFQTLFNQYQGGVNAYGDAAGANGLEGQERARANFQVSPGFDFALNKGIDALSRAGAAKGVATGNVLRGAQDYGQGMANQEWGNYINRLSPYLGQNTSVAGGLSNVYTGQGNALAGSFGQEGQAALGVQGGIGDANAAAALAPYNASKNMWDLGLQGAKLGAGLFGARG